MSRCTWLDAHTLYRSFRSVRCTEPVRWREVVDECRRSRRFRRWWLKTCRANPMFRAGWDWVGGPRNYRPESTDGR